MAVLGEMVPPDMGIFIELGAQRGLEIDRGKVMSEKQIITKIRRG
jgi:hypothetical protein